MRDLKIEDLKVGAKIQHKCYRIVKMVTKVDVKNNVVYYDNEGWDFIFGNAGMINNYYLLEDTKDEVEELIASRSNGTYSQISDDASAIIATLGTDEYAYFFSQIANKLARIKHGYSVEDSLLDIARYSDMKPTIMISNLDLGEFTAMVGQRVTSRIQQDGIIIPFEWEDYRAK